jgi:hypothetical protein
MRLPAKSQSNMSMEFEEPCSCSVVKPHKSLSQFENQFQTAGTWRVRLASVITTKLVQDCYLVAANFIAHAIQSVVNVV